jgi:hypothetical protein
MTSKPSYYNLPIIHSPVWTWQIGAYFFIGGAAGMSGVIAFAALIGGQPIALVRAATRLALAGAILSPVLLIWDLGRPARFLNMLRVFKWRSAMSVGVWTLIVFSAFAGSSFVALEVWPADASSSFRASVMLVPVAGTAISGAVLSTYTGVLLGVTAVPAWASHHRLLPVHFGVVALGSAAALLELIGFRTTPLWAIGVAASAVEVAIGGVVELQRRRAEGRALREGVPGWLLRSAGILTGPVSLVLRLAGFAPAAAACFVIGAIFSRYGWLLAGRASALDPEETLSAQRRP